MGSVLIESRMVGKLIGPRGATIQQLQNEYNVHISISKEDDAEGNRTAEIRGSDDDVQNAIQAIQERYCNQPGGGGGYQQQGGYRQGGGGGYRQNDGGRSYGNSGGYQQNQGGYRQNRGDGQWGNRGDGTGSGW
ncbi:CLUMA_CG015872, isoform A [Clunio marinus]|uniref:CLUMA_CG015872, isoform A n=1 Tax=Clunio marinus TaxID=568069 RepID=A0A1J1IWI0_9DIPT|nr:CLUMA_CG015872, isoform A [Clunio marinus]